MQLKKYIFFITFMLFLLFLSCEDKEWKNPFDANSDPKSWAPKNLQIEILSVTIVKLTWEQEEDNISGFKIDRKIGEENWQIEYAILDPNLTEWIDSSAVPDSIIYYRVYGYSGEKISSGIEGNINLSFFAPTNLTEVKIGTQVWMAENLKVTHYRTGDPIPNVTDNTEWSNLTTGAYCNYDNDAANVATYGRLYNWYAVSDSRNIAPEGWHMPSDEEWKELEMYLGMSQSEADITGWRGTDEGSKLKSTSGWSNNGNGTDDYGFSVLPGGARFYYGTYDYMGSTAYFWSSAEGSSYSTWLRQLIYYHSDVARSSRDKRIGFSVRCVRD